MTWASSWSMTSRSDSSRLVRALKIGTEMRMQRGRGSPPPGRRSKTVFAPLEVMVVEVSIATRRATVAYWGKRAATSLTTVVARRLISSADASGDRPRCWAAACAVCVSSAGFVGAPPSSSLASSLESTTARRFFIAVTLEEERIGIPSESHPPPKLFTVRKTCPFSAGQLFDELAARIRSIM